MADWIAAEIGPPMTAGHYSSGEAVGVTTDLIILLARLLMHHQFYFDLKQPLAQEAPPMIWPELKGVLLQPSTDKCRVPRR